MMMSETTGRHPRGADRTGIKGGFIAPATVVLHLVGVAVTAVALVSVFVPNAHLELLWQTASVSERVGRAVFAGSVVHLSVSALLWCGIATVVRRSWQMCRRPRRPRRATVRPRGSIYVETLAVFPVFLLLTFGLIQLVVVNLGGALAYVAAYESGRAVWLWEPELAENQVEPYAADTDVDAADVRERARIAAALVMTPVAPGDYAVPAIDHSEQFKAIRSAMTARFATGGRGADIDDRFGATGLEDRSPSLVRSLDSASMPERAYRKLSVAYLNTDILDIIATDERVGVHFRYYQRMVMPFVHALFGRHDHPVDEADGRYFRWDVEYTFPPQRHASNRSMPL